MTSLSNNKITNLAKGDISATSADAVNGSQLFGLGQSLSTAIGGGATVDTDGTVKAPSFALGNANLIGGTSGAAADVGSAFVKVDSALGKLNTSITNMNNGGGIKYFHTNSTLADSTASGLNATAIGPLAVASSESSVAIGNGATARSTSSIRTASLALGAGAIATADSGLAGDGAIAIGANAQAVLTGSGGSAGNGGNIAIGINASATGSGSWGNNTAIGLKANTSGYNGTAVGSSAQAGYNASALGGGANASGNGSTAMGQGAVAAGQGALALGGGASATTANSVALGAGSTTTADLTKAGYNSGSLLLAGTASTANGEVSLGSASKERRLTNLAAGASDTDAVNVSQLKSEAAKVNAFGANAASALGGGAAFNSTTGALSAPSYLLANANSIAGSSGAATDVGSGFAKVDSALGKLDSRTAQNTADIAGNSTSINNLDGRVTTVEGDISTLNTTINNMDGVLADAVMYDSAAHDKVTFGAAGTAVQLGNVKAGALSADSLDAVNGSQLFATNQQVGQNTAGISTLDQRVTVNEGDISNLDSRVTINEGGISSLDGRVTTVEGDISTLNTTISNMDGVLADAVMYDSAAHDKVTFGAAGTAVQLTNVKAGALAADSLDAVNGSQLFATNEQVGQNTADISSLDQRVTVNEGDISSLDSRVTINEGDISSLDGRVTTVEGDISTLNTTINNIDGVLTDAVMYDSAAHDKVNFGAAGTPVQLSNVKAGALSADSLDAVNGSQLFATNEQVGQNTADISTLDQRVAVNEGDISNLDSRVTLNEGDISSLDGRVTTVEGDISTLNTTINNMDGVLADAVMYDSAAHDKVSFGAAGAPVQLGNVKAGVLAADSLDAVNGSQLFATNQQVGQNTADISTLDQRVTVNEGDISNLDSRVTLNEGDISRLDGRVTTVEGDISNITNNINSGSIGLVQQAAAGANLTVGKDTDGTAVDFAGTAGARQLINVADGAVAAESKDAVNGSQLFATNEQVGHNSADISTLDQRVTINEGGISSLDGRVTINEGDISSLDGRVTTVEGDISNITNNINSGSIGLVQQAAAGANLTVGIDTDGAAVDFAGTAGARQLINVADGAVAAGSKEAVNGSQLFGVSQSVADVMGGNSVVNADGSISAPSYSVTNVDGSTSVINNVGDALSNIDNRTVQNTTDIAGNTTSINDLDGRVTNVEGDISTITNNINSGSIGLVQQFAAGANLTVGKGTDGAAVDFAGTAGARQLVNVAAGAVASASLDAVNGSQLFGVSQSVANAIGGNSVVNADGTVSTPSYSVTSIDGSSSIVSNVGDAISNLDNRTTHNTTSINNLNDALDNMSGLMGDAVMYDSAAHDKVTLGAPGKAVQLTNLKAGELSAQSSDAVNGAQLFETNSQVAIIDGRVTHLESSVMEITSGGGTRYFKATSVKAQAVAGASDSVAIGGAAVASAQGAVAIGDGAQASAQGSVALGQGASDNGRGAESYTGKYSAAQNDSVGTVAVGNATTGETRTISAVADAKQATDAVNLRQLDGAVSESKTYTDNRVTEITNNLGDSVNRVDELVGEVKGDLAGLKEGTEGMAQVNNTSRLPKPKATGNDSGAFGPGAEASGDNSLAMGSNAKARGKNSVAIGANSVADRDNSVAMGSAGNERQVTHVAAGTERTDAVNLGQVQDALGELASAAGSEINSLKRDLKEQEDDLSAGIAGAIAIASLSQPVINGGSTTAVGVGTYNGQSALSVGVSHMSNDGKWTTKLGGSSDTRGKFSAGASVGYNW